VLRALEAGLDFVETRPRGKYSEFVEDFDHLIRKITPDQAATLAEYHDRKWFRFEDKVPPAEADIELSQYDDLLMRASNPKFFEDDAPGQPRRKRRREPNSLSLLCQGPGCGKRFPAARRSKKYHSDACAKRAYRDRRMSRLRTDGHTAT
jgi:hypothetical protein